MARLTGVTFLLGTGLLVAMATQFAMATTNTRSHQVSRSEAQQMLNSMMEGKQDMQDILPWLLLLNNAGQTLHFSMATVMATAVFALVAVNGLLTFP